MTDGRPDDRIPVVVAAGQAIERSTPVTPVELMTRACQAALADAPRLRPAIDRLSVVDIMTRTGPAPATELARSLGIDPMVVEVTTIGGNSPQWLVSRAASAIAAGSLGVTLIAGAEAIRSSRQRHRDGLPRDLGDSSLAPDPVVGDDLPGIGPAEAAAGVMAPVQVYPLFESVLAARAGRTADQQRRVIGELFAPFSRVAAGHPFAWFPEALTAERIATPGPDNRLVCEPYTKRMTAFLGSDQAAALLVCSLGAARRAGVADRAVFVWAGAETVDVRFPTARPDPGRSPAIRAAGEGLFRAAAEAAGSGASAPGIDDIDILDLYSCFPCAVEMAAEALGLAFDDPRGLTATGGLPYFGGPGNNYTTHGIATVTDRLRQTGGGTGRLGLATGLGWFATKHALGLYGSEPPPGGFRRAVTDAEQAAIDATAVPTPREVPEATTATVVAVTVQRDHHGTAVGAPLIARLPDGSQVMAVPADDQTLAGLGEVDTPGLVGTDVVVGDGPPRYRLAH